MNGMQARRVVCAAAVVMFAGAWMSQAQAQAVNGYTYIVPSVYPAPPIVVYDPVFVVPARSVILPGPTYVAPVPVISAEPAFVSQTFVPYNPVWNYGPVVGPTTYRERARVGRYGVDYKYQVYAPGRHAPVYTYKVDAERHGVKVRERYR